MLSFQGIVKQLFIQEGKISSVSQELCVIEVDETLNGLISGAGTEVAEVGSVNKTSVPVPEVMKPSVSEEFA